MGLPIILSAFSLAKSRKSPRALVGPEGEDIRADKNNFITSTKRRKKGSYFKVTLRELLFPRASKKAISHICNRISKWRK